jgi:cytochrome o ubiquinol oxidase subunit 3
MSQAVTYENAPHAPEAHGAGPDLHATSTGIENKKLLMWLFLASDCMFFGTLISTHLVYRKVYPFGALQKGIVDVTRTFDIELTSFSTFILFMSSFLMALAVSAMRKGQIQSFRRMVVGVMLFGLIFLGCQVYEFTQFFAGEATYTYAVNQPGGKTLTGEYHGAATPAKAEADLVRRLVADHPDWVAIPATATAAEKQMSPAELAAAHPQWLVSNFKLDKVEKASLSLQNSVFGSTFYLMTGTHGCHVAVGVLWLGSLFLFSFTGKMQRDMNTAAVDVGIAGLYWHFVDLVWIVIFTAVYLVEYVPGYTPAA